MDKIKILYIDDEKDNLMAFNSSFRRVFDVYIAESAAKGIDILKTNNIEILIADQRMPEMTGVEFFESILIEHPNPIRILLTGYSDINAVKDAINKGQVHRYLTKPWDEYELKVIIENAYLVYQLKEQNNKLKNKYQKVFVESNDAIMLFDSEGRLIDYNKAALALFKAKRPQLNLTYFADLVNNKQEGEYLFKTLSMQEKGIANYESKLSFNGVVKNCLISANRISDNYGESVTFQAIIRDVTQNTEIEQLMMKSALTAQETERARISRDLHDGLGQSLVGIKFQLEQLKIDSSSSQLKLIENTSDILASTIQQLRRICYDILPPALSDYGLKKAIEQLCQNFSKTNLKITPTISHEIPPLEKELEITLYRIVQEFIQNAIKHANCSAIDISLKYFPNELLLVLCDNGKGFNIDTVTKGLGISNISSRIKSFNGDFEIVSRENSGTEFRIKIPLNKDKNETFTNIESKDFIKEIKTTTLNIGLRKDGILVSKHRLNWRGTINKKHAIENVTAYKKITENKLFSIVHYLSDDHISNDAIEYYTNNMQSVLTLAVVYQSFLQKKISESLFKHKTSTLPTEVFENEKDALVWIRENQLVKTKN